MDLLTSTTNTPYFQVRNAGSKFPGSSIILYISSFVILELDWNSGFKPVTSVHQSYRWQVGN